MKHWPVLTPLLTLVLVVGMAACEHEAELPPPHQPPVASITMTSPAEGAVFHNGDTVTIDATAVSTDIIHGYTVAIQRANDTTTYYFREVHAHNDTLRVHQQWKDTLTAPVTLEARITIVVDHDGRRLTARRAFRHE